MTGQPGPIVDLFRGPGGWSEGLRALGLVDYGVENDPSAHATATAAGHAGECSDVLDVDPRAVVRASAEAAGTDPDGELWGLIASPPCQTFSKAGKGEGRRAFDRVRLAVAEVAVGRPVPHFEDVRTALVVEPLRWTLELRPEWFCWEQVPTVLSVWEACADVLRAAGYDVAVGLVNAEEYGVAQTRTRAVLIGSRTRRVRLPQPTHTRYRRNDPRELIGLLPWVSMADALGYGMTHRPYPVIASSRSTGGPDKEKLGGSEARRILYEEIAAGRWLIVSGGGTRRDTIRSTEEPAGTLAFGHDAARFGWTTDPDGKISFRLCLEDAGVLQSFPRDYPWTGGATKRFQQIGNAVPPLMAAAIVRAATGPN